jgi:ankyrin repeat protein
LLGPVSEQRADDERTKSDEFKFKALTEASMKDQWDVVELLLKGGFKENDMYKASYNALRNKFGGNLHHAAGNGYGATVQLCLHNGVDIDCEDSNGWRALHWAANGGYEATVEQLIDSAADREARTNDGSTALHLASRGGHDSTIRLLIEHFGTDREAKKYDGSTALHLAASEGHDSTAQLLIRNFSVDKKIKNFLGETALFLLLRYMLVSKILFYCELDSTWLTS